MATGPTSSTTTSTTTTDQSFIAPKGTDIPEQSSWTQDQGVDIPFAGHVAMLAVGPGKIVHEGISGFGNWAPVLQVTSGPLQGKTFYYGHCGPNFAHTGDTVQAGQKITQIADPTVGISTGPHIEFGQSNSSGTPTPGSSDSSLAILKALQAGHLINEVGGTPGSAGTGDTTGGASVESVAKAAALSTFLELPTVEVSAESQMLTGERSLMNDLPLLPFIEQLCQGSLRNFQSMPNGNFFAFYSDYFGGLSHRTAYWEIKDIEILDGRIQLSDDALATHVYVVGDIAPPFGTGVDIIDSIHTAGVVNIFNAFLADFINGTSDPALVEKDPSKKTTEQAKFDAQVASKPSLANKRNAQLFLEKYGARAYREEAPMVRSPFFEMFLAYQKFCLMWSQQFLTTFEFTFMPELFPGGIVKFPDHGIQCYIEEVEHTCNYQSGFTTRANLSSPAAIRDKAGNTTGRTNINQGMVRAGAFSAGGPTSGSETPQATTGGRNTG